MKLIPTKPYSQNKTDTMEAIIREFIEWEKDCGEDAWYIFENTDIAIEEFMKQREDDKE